jgi:hypothetical protein
LNRRFGLLVLLTIAGLPRPGHAQEPPVARDPRSRQVEVHIDVAGSQTAILATADTALELFARLHIIPTIRAVDDVADTDRNRDPAGSGTMRIHAVIDLRSMSAPTVHVTETGSQGVLVRRVLPPSTSFDVTVESAAHIVYAAVDSLLRATETRSAGPASPGGARAVSSTEADPSTVAEGMPRLQGLGLGVDVGIFLAVNAFEGPTPYYGAGANVELRARKPSPRLAVRMSATLYASAHHEVANVDAAIKAVSFRLVPTIEWLRTSTLAGVLGIGPGLDWFRVSPTPPPLTVGQVRQSSSNLDPIVAAVVGARIRLGRALTLTLDLGLDLDCAPRRYVAAGGDNSVDLFAPSRFRPTFTAGLSFPVAGVTRSEEATRAGIERLR